jgi:hypothetical protein
VLAGANPSLDVVERERERWSFLAGRKFDVDDGEIGGARVSLRAGALRQLSETWNESNVMVPCHLCYPYWGKGTPLSSLHTPSYGLAALSLTSKNHLRTCCMYYMYVLKYVST